VVVGIMLIRAEPEAQAEGEKAHGIVELEPQVLPIKVEAVVVDSIRLEQVLGKGKLAGLA